MEQLPNEMIMNILSFLYVSELGVVSKTFLPMYRSNVIWRPLVIHKFGTMKSTNYFKEYAWQLKLKKHQFYYTRHFTMGCVGRTTPPTKEDWPPVSF